MTKVSFPTIQKPAPGGLLWESGGQEGGFLFGRMKFFPMISWGVKIGGGDATISPTDRNTAAMSVVTISLGGIVQTGELGGILQILEIESRHLSTEAPGFEALSRALNPMFFTFFPTS